jgi:hypothetical protein
LYRSHQTTCLYLPASVQRIGVDVHVDGLELADVHGISLLRLSPSGERRSREAAEERGWTGVLRTPRLPLSQPLP